MINKFLRIICFLLIGIFLIQIVQYIFIPKRSSYTDGYDTGKLTGLYREKNNSIDVIIGGTSHSAGGIYPMELYEKYGITSYNLSTGIQPIEVTYYILREALKTQTPKVFIFDVSNLWFTDNLEFYWRFVLDEMHIGENKLAFAKEYCTEYQNEDESATMQTILFPLSRYNTRRKNLKYQDFTYFFCDKHDYGKGAVIASTISDNGISVESINEATKQLLQNTEKKEYIYEMGAYVENIEEDVLYSTDIPEENLVWFLKIKDLCVQNGIQLLAIKVPTIDFPQNYQSSWTDKKYNKIRSLCEQYGILYYDLLYEANINIDWSKDSLDGGHHLNFNGAQKVTENIGQYLKDHYELLDEHNEQWDRDLLSYQKIRKVVQLQLEQDFKMYINSLTNEYKDKMIFIVASNGIAALYEEDITALRKLGLQTDFTNASRNAYIAVMTNGEVIYEALSNRKLYYTGTCAKSKKEYELYSSGWWTGQNTFVKLEDNEFNFNGCAINIVVYDDDRGLILDNVCFDISSEKYTAVRNNATINGFRQNFEKYVTEIEDQ